MVILAIGQLNVQILCFLIRLLQFYMVILAIGQLNVQILCFLIRLLQSSTCFEQRRAHHQKVKLY
jgi:hypothetical protein